MGHHGRTNSFHVNRRDKLALTYNDRSVLENYHLATAFDLISSSSSVNLFEGLSDQLVSSVRSDAIDMVLATDMTVHFSKVGSFVELTARLGDDPEEWYDDERAMSAFR